ncbi:major facilitator superfamily permease [Klebsiella aerogenes]|nr:major facilitator superfamily permease [Klebsiella aerogenes]
MIASGASPVIMGVLIDNHVTLHLQALFCLVYILGASLLATGIRTDAPQ